MSEIDVRIVRLEPMRVASFHAFGATPEHAAWQKMTAWAAKELPERGRTARVFGFNNPNPAPGSPNYGYEFWIEIGAEAAGGEVTVKAFDGGLYAVTRCQGAETIGPTWQRLAAWCEDSRYRLAHHQWLEEHIGPLEPAIDEFVLTLDLFCPIAE